MARRSVVNACLAALTLSILALAACGGGGGGALPETPTPLSAADCSVEEATAIKSQVEPLIDRFDDVNARAANTSRIALSPVVGEMQEVRRDLKALEPPSCAEQAVDYSVDYMDKGIAAYIAFLGDEPDSEVEWLFEEAVEAQDDSVVELAIIFAKAEE